jgi:tripartite-type tricarboxylate transporter receptor subunit TctC
MNFFGLFVTGLATCFGCHVFALSPASAQSDYPSRPITIVMPFTAGGAGDILIRAIAQELKSELNQSVVVENVTGAGGEIAAGQVARSAPDGYRMLFATAGPLNYAPSVHLTKPPYDPIKDFSPVTTLGVYSAVLAVHESVPARNLKELVAHAKANPNKLAYGTSNSTGIVTMVQLTNAAGIEMLHIPYKGEAQALPDLLAGRIHLMILSPQVLEQLQGKAKPVVVFGPHRVSGFPDVRTVTEEGFAGINVVQWLGFVMPGGTPKAIVQRMSQALNTVFGKPEIKKRAESSGTVIGGSTPEQMAELIKTQLDAWRAAVKAANIPTD